MSKGRIAVIGGAGYIGSFTSRALKNAGYEPIIIDNFSSGHKAAVYNLPVFELDILSDKEKLAQILDRERIEAIIHFAGLIQAGESMKDPALYFRYNIQGSINVFEAARKVALDKIVFSSSAGVYGNPEVLPIPENHPKNPTNPYGESKAMVEKILSWYWEIFKISSVSVRYFNAAGAELDGSHGEDHPYESHLIPKLIKAALTGEQVIIFGNDYKTKDGTCIRDYIHVIDLAEVHIKALEYLKNHKGFFAFNAGTGYGYSNLEILKKVEEIVGKKINFVFGQRRPGDAASIFADPTKAKKSLGWRPSYSDLETIIASAWKWHSSHPNGYRL